MLIWKKNYSEVTVNENGIYLFYEDRRKHEVQNCRQTIIIYLRKLPQMDLTTLNWQRFGLHPFSPQLNRSEKIHILTDFFWNVVSFLNNCFDPTLDELQPKLNTCIWLFNSKGKYGVQKCFDLCWNRTALHSNTTKQFVHEKTKLSFLKFLSALSSMYLFSL